MKKDLLKQSVGESLVSLLKEPRAKFPKLPKTIPALQDRLWAGGKMRKNLDRDG